jgi:hypothetical protein
MCDVEAPPFLGVFQPFGLALPKDAPADAAALSPSCSDPDGDESGGPTSRACAGADGFAFTGRGF